jgi:C4-dicarboxylate transporter DctQ subunit
VSTQSALILALALAAAAAVRAALERRGRLAGLFRLLARLELGVIALLLAGLVVLGCLQIVLRNVFHGGLLWADPLMRHLVLWLGCLGAALATTRIRHITIDVFTRVLPAPLRPWRRVVVYLATAVAAFVLGMAALRLVVDERAFGETAFGSIPVWVLQTVLPWSFCVIAYRSLVNLLLGREADPEEAALEAAE